MIITLCSCGGVTNSCPGSQPKVNCHVNNVCQLMIRVIMGKTGAMYRYPHDCRNPWKSSVRDSLTKAVRPVIASNAISYLEMAQVGSQSTCRRKKEGKNERMRRVKYNILLNIMFHAPIGRFQLELIYCFTFVFTRRPTPSSICMFLSFRPFVVITTFSTGLVGVEITSVSWLGQLTVRI